MKNRIESLFNKYLNNECSSEELEELIEYFNIKENEELLRQCILNELKSDTSEDELSSGIDARLVKVQGRILQRIARKKAPVLGLHKKTWLNFAAAAAVVLIAGAFFFYNYLPQSGEALKEQVAASGIKPGKNQAILTLPNGEQILLSDALNEDIKSQSGMSIAKSANGQLVFTVLDDGISTGFNTVEAPAGGTWQVVLADKSRVWLNAKSSITFPSRFAGNAREVKLKGEAYFEIAQNKAMPFKVESGGQVVEVLGTHFDVMAYADEDIQRTTLLEGSVKISGTGFQKILKPGEQALVQANAVEVSNKVDLEEVIAWKDGYFKFNESLESIMSKIARWYDVEIVYDNKPDPTQIFAGEISRYRDLSEILTIMEYTGKVKFTIEGRRIIVEN